MTESNQDHSKLSNIESELKSLKASIAEISERQEDYSQTLRELPSKSSIMKEVTTEIEELNKKIKDTQTSLEKKISEQSASAQGFELVEEKLEQLEAQLLSKDDNDYANLIAELQEQVKAFEAEINKIPALEEKIDENQQNTEYSVESLVERIDNLESASNTIKTEKNEEVASLKKKIEEISKAQVAQPEPVEDESHKVDEEVVEALRTEIDEKLHKLQEDLKHTHDKAFGKIGEIKAEVDKADEKIKQSIDELRQSNNDETAQIFDRIIDIKNELLEDSKNLKAKFEKIDQVEDKKHETVMEEISKLHEMINEQKETVIEAAEKVGQSKPEPQVIDTSKIDEKIEKVKADMLSSIEGKNPSYLNPI